MTIRSYDTYLFDADGTLLNTAELVFQTFLYACRKYGGFDIERSRVTADMGQPLVEQIQRYLGFRNPQDLAAILADYRDYQLGIYQAQLTVFPGVCETLQALREAGKKLAVVTSRRMETTDIYLKACDLHDFFDLIITPEATDLHKPNPEPALKALELMQSKPSEALFIGDAHFDIACGQGAGTDTALVAWSLNDPDTMQPRPTYILEKMEDLLAACPDASGAAGTVAN